MNHAKESRDINFDEDEAVSPKGPSDSVEYEELTTSLAKPPKGAKSIS